MAKANKFIHFLFPDWYTPDQESISYFQTLAWTLFISFILFIIYGIFFIFSGFYLGLIVVGICTVFMLVSLYLFKFTHHTTLAGSICVGVIFGNAVHISYLSGGIDSPIIVWLLLVPILSNFILSRRHGRFWVAFTLIALIYFLFFPEGSSKSFTNLDSPIFNTWFNLFILTIILWISAIIIDSAKNQASEDAILAKEKSIKSEKKLKVLAFELEMDIERRKKVESALRESEERLNLAIQGAELGLWDWDVKSGTVSCSRKWYELLGYTENDIDNSYAQWVNLIHPEDTQMAEKALVELIEGQASIYRSEHRVRSASGNYIWIMTNGAVMETDEEDRPIRIVGIQFDISERKHSEEEFQRLASIDTLTGLINRRRFFELAKEEFERVKRYRTPLSVAIFDVDDFKLINDSYGHLIGDFVLGEIASACQKQLRQIDVLARYGGEEFVILLPHTTLEEARVTLERMRENLASYQIETKAGPVSSTISVGLSTVPAYSRVSIDSLLNQADKALYTAKERGKNQVVCWGPKNPTSSDD